MKTIFLVIACVFSLAAQAQTYPGKPIRIVVPYAAGGTSDILARQIGPKLTEAWGQPAIVENKPGANGNVGADFVAKSAPDGYTLLLTDLGGLVISASVYPKLPFNPSKDFSPVVMVSYSPHVLAVNPEVQVKNVKELIAMAKAYPGKLNYGSPGAGSQNRLETEVFRKLENLDMVHVPYKGGAGPAVAGLVGGETHLMFVTASSAMNHVKSGRLRLIAVTSAKRLQAFPDAPTMAESGYPELTSGSWQGIFVPTGTPKEAVDKLYSATIETMKTPEVRQRLANGGVEVITSAPGEFAKFVAKETERWGRAVKEAGATAE